MLYINSSGIISNTKPVKGIAIIPTTVDKKFAANVTIAAFLKFKEKVYFMNQNSIIKPIMIGQKERILSSKYRAGQTTSA